MSKPTSTLERLTVVETKIDIHSEMLRSLINSNEAIRTDLNKYKGAWGAISLLVAAIFACVGLLKDWLLRKFGAS